MDVLNEVIIPCVGLITATILFYSPLPAMLIHTPVTHSHAVLCGGGALSMHANNQREVEKSRLLGPINIFPLAMIAPNCSAWMFYSLFMPSRSNGLWLWWANMPSFLVALWYLSVILRAIDVTVSQLRMVQVITGGGLALTMLGLMCIMVVESDATRASIMGVICIILLVIFYTAPLSTLYSVLKTRDSSPLLLPLAITQALNGAAWTAFGFYLQDPFLYGPNSVGAINGVIQIACCLIFPRTAAKEARVAAAAAAAKRRADKLAAAEDVECGKGGGGKRGKGFGFGAGGHFASCAELCEPTALVTVADGGAASPVLGSGGGSGGGSTAGGSSPGDFDGDDVDITPAQHASGRVGGAAVAAADTGVGSASAAAAVGMVELLSPLRHA